MKPATAVAAVGATLSLVACGSSTTTLDVSGETALVKKGLAHTNASAKSIHCQTGVEAKVGNTATCTVKLTNGQTATFVLKVDRKTNSGFHLTIVKASAH